MVSLFDNCPACRGTRQIEVQMKYSVQVSFDDEPPPYVGAGIKSYPCPECMPVFYRHDLIQANIQQPLRQEFKSEPTYKTSIENHIARQLGQFALIKGGMSFRDGQEMGIGFRYHVGTMYVVKNTAQGLKK